MQRPATSKKLQLNRETVKSLDDQDLGKVAGGSIGTPMSRFIICVNSKGGATGAN